jgi:molybdopterin molybdotransferase
VYESNSYMLNAVLRQLHVKPAEILFCADNFDMTVTTIATALEKADIILLTGGVSVGDYDFVPEAAAACGVKKHFHKIKQRPGKPLFFGTKENKLLFGLPGNPSSVLTCFYEYVLYAMHLANNNIAKLKTVQAPLANDFNKQKGLAHFLKAVYDGKNIATLGAQESYRLSSFAKANCLAIVDEETTNVNAGSIIEAHLLPF